MYLNVNINDRVNLKVSQVSVNQMLAIQKAISESAQSLDWSVMKSVTVNGNPPADGDNLASVQAMAEANDTQNTEIATKLPKSGGTMTGLLHMLADLEIQKLTPSKYAQLLLKDSVGFIRGGITLDANNKLTLQRRNNVGVIVNNLELMEDGINLRVNGTPVVLDTSAAAVLVGGIILFSGVLAAMPTGWALCDGTKGTPNLPSIDGGSTVYIQRIA